MTESYPDSNAWTEREGLTADERARDTGGIPADPYTAGGPGYPSAPTTPQHSTTETVKGEAAAVGQETADSVKHVAGVAKDEAAHVVSEASTQVKDLLTQSRTELVDQAGAQQHKVAQGLRSLGEELESMAAGSQEPGVATDLVRQAAERSSRLAEWLDVRDPGSLLTEVKSFARKRPGTFLALAAGAGILAGRLTRSLSAGAPPAATAPRTAAPASAPVPSVPMEAVPPQPAEPPYVESAVYGSGNLDSGELDDGFRPGSVSQPGSEALPSARPLEEVPVVEHFEGGDRR